MFQLILSGFALGCVYSLVALGYHITFITSRTLNFAQGSAMMLGAVITLMLVVDFGWPTAPAAIVAILLLGIFGFALERLAVRPFVRRGSMAWVMSTLAVGIIIENVAQLIFGKSPRGLPNELALDPVTIGGAGIYPLELLIPVVVVAVALGARLFYGATMLGRALRATAFDREASLAVGINVNWMVGLSYAASSMLVAALAYGIAENLVGGNFGSSVKEIFGFGLVILVLFLRPSGLFGRTRLRRV